MRASFGASLAGSGLEGRDCRQPVVKGPVEQGRSLPQPRIGWKSPSGGRDNRQRLGLVLRRKRRFGENLVRMRVARMAFGAGQ